ncbi:ABC transporter ATP-binding protein [Mesorhizobium sp. VK4C]|uniref:ABC transporter ATP-binding protein n=1 Tax=Mesorhizobium captivum TaxID=3072319 RepID=UPI002A2411AC|nr:ABC transporter ATP-binding protein [Mesorhizobium sp. VK4C]MDX8500729.1 ABC transporter ATP-binding protein [Mesorhizobium sp. VK4C]
MARVEVRHVSKSFGNITAVEDFSLVTSDGEFIALVGPSGCGKTSIMRMIAGLETVSEGQVLFDDKDVTNELPRDRDVAMVFQNYALFPHLNVYSNLAFGLQLRKTPKAEIEARVKNVVRMLDIEELLSRRPRELSGGQRQRVALGRAIMREPRVFLMDEPLSNLDAALRMEMRAEIIKLQERLGITTFYVTHDQVEALSMGDRVVVMRSGRLQQVGTPMELYERPTNSYVAGFIGSPPMNFLAARANGSTLTLEVQDVELELSGRLSAALRESGSANILLGVRPEHVALSDHPASDGLYSLEATVDTVEPLGHTILVRTKLSSQQHINVLISEKIPWRAGAGVHLIFRPEHVYLFDKQADRLLCGLPA